MVSAVVVPRRKRPLSAESPPQVRKLDGIGWKIGGTYEVRTVLYSRQSEAPTYSGLSQTALDRSQRVRGSMLGANAANP